MRRSLAIFATMFSKSTIAGIAVLLCPALASAQLRFGQPTVDLGELRAGPVYQHRFDFVNDSMQPIEIIDIRLGCGCLQPVLDKRTIQPAEKGTLLFHIRKLGQPSGARTWQAHVQYRVAGKLQETALTLGASLRTEIAIEPSIIAMSVEKALTQEITFTDHRALPARIVNVQASSPAIQVTSKELGNGVTKLTLQVTGAALTASRQEEELNIYTDDANYRHLQVPISLARVTRPAVSATPDRIEISGKGSQLVRLRAKDDQQVRIEKAEADQPGIKCTWAAGPGNDATLRIMDAAETDGTKTGVVRVVLSEPAGATVTIPFILRH